MSGGKPVQNARMLICIPVRPASGNVEVELAGAVQVAGSQEHVAVRSVRILYRHHAE